MFAAFTLGKFFASFKSRDMLGALITPCGLACKYLCARINMSRNRC